MSAECVITGVQLVVDWPGPDGQERGYPGDLFDLGDVWIINANESGGPQPVSRSQRCLFLKGDAWNRRGVYVVKKTEAQLNPAAEAYIIRSRAA